MAENTKAVQSTAGSGRIERYARLTIVTHWMSALSFVVLLSAIWARELIEQYAVRVNLLGLHRQLGLVLLILWVVRLLARKIYPKKPSGKQMTKPLKVAVFLCHTALYGMLLAMPLLGWLLTNAHGTPVQFLGVIQLPTLVDRNDDLEDLLMFVHEYCAYLMVALVTSHMLAALWHHIVRKDHVLAAMVPFLEVDDQPAQASAPQVEAYVSVQS